jgi:hypothetical protein
VPVTEAKITRGVESFIVKNIAEEELSWVGYVDSKLDGSK